mgnify:CR=1 FL=1
MPANAAKGSIGTMAVRGGTAIPEALVVAVGDGLNDAFNPKLRTR